MSETETQEHALYFDVQQKTDKQHILDNPDTYIGSVENVDATMWVMNADGNKIIEKPMNYVPGLFKLFDEGIVNCRDHVVRMQSKIDQQVPNSLPVSHIDISIQTDGTIVMTNDGNGIDVVEHPEYKTWVPELIFGHLRTSTNYNKDEKKIVGGKNGFGFKLVLIWSTFGSVETVDHIRGLKYYQEFQQNLDVICSPKITKATKSKPYTKITFKPDYARLKLNGLNEDMVSLLKKRVYDISAITNKNIKVKYNNELVPVKNFEQYIHLYIGGDKTQTPRVYEEANPRWEYAVALTPTNEFIQVSFVNGIYTSKGGKHVEYVLNQITRKMMEFIEKKKKIKVNPNSIKEQLILFIRCDIENPTFDSQTKDYMNTPSSKFGSKCEVSDKFIEKLVKMGVMDAACAITEVKENKAAKKTDGTKRKNIKGIPKLDDANWAGTDKSHLCALILTEGDSAKTAAISGLTSDHKNMYGLFPLKGKVMNVRGETSKKILDNEEIHNLKQILGLETGREYNSIEDVHKYLRYGRIMLMTDQDLDGSHIKGLNVNLFHHEWASLIRIPGFIGFMNTPILKAKKGQQELVFYNQGEYDVWRERPETNIKSWNMKYYKGLGSSTKTEFRAYFEEMRFVGFEYNGSDSDNAIDMVFNKKRANDRKRWLETEYDRHSFINTNKSLISYEEFINKELIHFSKYDCDRSIPNLVDGLKTSLRKILYSAFKKRLTTEIKVAQFSGYVSEHSCYHHGEDSLNKAIVGLAQNFMGSNNINLLYPSGQFGSRIKGGQDASSPRYIFTRLEKITRVLFPEQDDLVLNYLDDDGFQVEPQYYVPIIPMVLVNGSMGIGTGFSTYIMCYHPLNIINYLKHKIQNPTELCEMEFVPYYEGFKGTIEKLSPTKFLFKGKYEKIDNDTIRVTELPVGFWTQDFKNLLDTLQNDKDDEGKKIVPLIRDKPFENYTDVSVDFVIPFTKGKVQELESAKGEYGCNGLEKVLKLYSTSSTTNMHLFDHEDKLKKYEKVEDIINDYFEIRIKHYVLRKAYIIREKEEELVVLQNKARYIQEVLDGTIDLRRLKQYEINALLQTKQYVMISHNKDNDKDYKYLIKMPMDSVSIENVEHLLKVCTTTQHELDIIKSTSEKQMWLNELEVLEHEYKLFQIERNEAQCDVKTEKAVKQIKKEKAPKKGK